MKIKMYRREFAHGCFSELFIDGERFCVTAERPWQNNEKNISCVPYGHYKLIPHNSPRFGECYILYAPSLGVTKFGPSQRTHCLFHVANLPSKLAGCVAPGSRFGVVSGQWGVINSKSTLLALKERLGDEVHDLEILKA